MSAEGLAIAPSWLWITRLGEAQLLLPALLAAGLGVVRIPALRMPALRWLGLLGLAVLATTLSKVAFIGWGVGLAALDFTGISGHAMFAAAVGPALLGTALSRAGAGGRWLGFGAGVALAFVVGVSRWVVGAHSVSEVVAGLLTGALVWPSTVALLRLPELRVSPLLPLAVAAWLSWTPSHAPASQTHAAVTRLALALAGHDSPYRREHLWRPRSPSIGRS